MAVFIAFMKSFLADTHRVKVFVSPQREREGEREAGEFLCVLNVRDTLRTQCTGFEDAKEHATGDSEERKTKADHA